MIHDRKSPEHMLPESEFIKVVYDNKGRPIDVVPVDGVPSTPQQEQAPKITVQRQIISQPVNQENVVNWIVNLGQQIKALREDLRLMAIFTQKKFNELQPVMSSLIEKEVSKSSPVVNQRLIGIENEISGLKNQYNYVLENFQLFSTAVVNLTKKLEGIKLPEKAVFDQLNSLNLHVAAITKEFANLSNLMENVSQPSPVILENLQQISHEINSLLGKLERTIISEGAILDHLNSLDSRMSNVAKEIAGSKLHEIETTEKLKTLIEDTKESKISDLEMFQRLSSIEDENGKLRNEVTTLNNHIANVASGMEEFSGLKDEVKERIDSLSVKQEELTTKLFEKSDRRFTRLLNKMKKGEKKINRARIVRMFKKKLNLPLTKKVFIVSDKRNSSFGTLLFDVARKMNKKTVLAVMENRKRLGQEPEKAVREAMLQADFIVITAKYSLEKTKVLRKCLKLNKKVFAINRSLRVSKLTLLKG